MQLPALGGAFVMNNPYGTDMILGELVPSKVFGTSALEFNLAQEIRIQLQISSFFSMVRFGLNFITNLGLMME